MNIKDKNVLFTIEWVSETKKDKVHADRYQAAQSQAVDKLYKVNDREGLYVGVASENGIYGHSRFCNTDFDDKLACLNLSGV
ncbi:hypothetical protein P0161_28225 [Klebsiella pneumoniae]|uniref:hypothetical protein n=1 Tax=Klebsiella pneumoniae TaxID=573 RepID=UPI002265DFE9|nr:hypothetical protein [Klebsiella pneumoniae]